jgi:enterochelin esterase family protein
MTTRGRIHHARIQSLILQNNPLGDSPTRDLYIYLPPSYDRDTSRRFPVVHVLTGFTGRGRMLLNDNAFTPNLAERMDGLIAAGTVREMIVAMPDCFTRLGGSQYEDHFVNELVPFVDENFRTIPDRTARAVVGKSSGGYGALIHAMRHPEVFALAASHAGDCLFEYCYLPGFAETFRAIHRKGGGDVARYVERFWADERKGGDDHSAINTIGMSACYSPDPEAPLGLRLPFSLQTGELDLEVWERWLAHDPVRMIERHEDYRDALRSMRLLYLDAGTRDEYALDLGARAFTARLSAAGIHFIHEEFDDGHRNISYRYDRSLELVSRAFGA